MRCLVVGRVPGLLDHRAQLVSLDQDAALFVHREVRGPDHPLHPARPQPCLGGAQQGLQHLLVVLELEEPVPAPLLLLVVVERVVDLGGDPSHDPPVAPGDEVLGLAMAEERVHPPVQEQPALELRQGDPQRVVSMQSERQVDELFQVSPAGDRCDLDACRPVRSDTLICSDQSPADSHRLRSIAHWPRPYMPTSTDASATPTDDPPGGQPVDVFAKVRGHEREELLRAAREADVLPYFHVLTSAAMPVVEMEGAERIMLGSNNYLGLTGDERVMAGAEDALHRYGTGLTGSRFLNGTIPLHLELEQEIAEWMNTDAALVFTTGHQANLVDARHDPLACRHGDRRLRRPRLDLRRLPALAREAARLPPQPPRQAREDARSAPRPTAAACWSSSTGSSRWRATSRRCARSASSARATARA